MIIPNSLWESTKDLDKQIFYAISPEDIRHMMNQSFADKNLIEQFTAYTNMIYRNNEENNITKFDILLTNITVNICPNIIEDICAFIEYAKKLKIMKSIKNYKPTQRPIVGNLKVKNLAEFNRKRKLIVRDWLFFVVWAKRIEQAIEINSKNDKEINSEQNEIEELYKKLLRKKKELKVSNKWDNTNINELENTLKFLKIRMGNSAKVEESPKEIETTIRCQNLSLNLFTNNMMTSTAFEIKLNEKLIRNFRLHAFI